MESKLLITLDREVHLDFKCLCAKKGITMAEAVRKIILWSLKKELHKDYFLPKEEETESSKLAQEIIDKGRPISMIKRRMNQNKPMVMASFRDGLTYEEISLKYQIPLTTVRRWIMNEVEKAKGKSL